MWVIFFDGVCNLCNASVNYIIDADKNKVFRFSSLQSAYGQQTVQQFRLQDNYLDTVVVTNGKQVFVRSDAFLQIAGLLGGWYKLFTILKWIPRPIRDFFYRIVARNRYQWFGQRDTCRVPEPHLVERFIQ